MFTSLTQKCDRNTPEHGPKQMLEAARPLTCVAVQVLEGLQRCRCLQVFSYKTSSSHFGFSASV